MVCTEAVTKELSKKHREENGEKGGVVSLVYLCAFLLRKGESLATPLGGQLPDWIPVKVRIPPLLTSLSVIRDWECRIRYIDEMEQEDGTCTMMDAKRKFYNDLPDAEAEHWFSLLKPHPAIAQTTELTNEGYRYVPVTYLFCENDQALPVVVQKAMVETALQGDFTGVTCGSGHSPFLSMPEKVVEVIESLRG